LALAALASAPVVNGYTFAQDYGNLGGQVGSDLSAAQNNSATDQSLLSQAESLRQQISGVSLNSEAESLLQYNRSYDAISKMLGVLNSLSLDIVNLLPPISSS
jgi:flagellar hook-associated protein 1 FlgK